MTSVQELVYLLFNVGMPVGIVVIMYALFSRSALGRALIERLRDGKLDKQVLREMREEMRAMHEDVMDLQERFDVLERKLGPAVRGGPRLLRDANPEELPHPTPR